MENRVALARNEMRVDFPSVRTEFPRQSRPFLDEPTKPRAVSSLSWA
jgi:hypothetical protein